MAFTKDNGFLKCVDGEWRPLEKGESLKADEVIGWIDDGKDPVYSSSQTRSSSSVEFVLSSSSEQELFSSAVESSSSDAKSSSSVIQSSSSKIESSSSQGGSSEIYVCADGTLVVNVESCSESSSSSVAPESSDDEDSSSSEYLSSSEPAESSSSENLESSSSEEQSSSSESLESSSSEDLSSSSEEVSSSSVVDIPYTTECPSGVTCTYTSTAYLNPKITFGELLDKRDYQVYKTVTIGSQTWMAQNLNYDYNEGSARSYCYGESADSCAKYGRLYTWMAAMDSVGIFGTAGKGCGNRSTCSPGGVVRGVCPEGWHLPSDPEWNVLINKAGYYNHAGGTLKSMNGWAKDGGGPDTYGFAALPAGYFDEYGYDESGYGAQFWSSYAYSIYEGKYQSFSTNFEVVYEQYGDKSNGRSVRCILNSAEQNLSSSSSIPLSSAGDVPESGSSRTEKIPYTTECPEGKNCSYAPTEQLNESIAYGELLDVRDYQVYKTVKIGNQTWLAQNLNYDYNVGGGKSICYEESVDSCYKYGRLYTWSAAMDSAAVFGVLGKGCGYGKMCNHTGTVGGVCPAGWHLPSKAEWNKVISFAGGSNMAGKNLKSTSGWTDDGNGSDLVGFSVIPSGRYMEENGFVVSKTSKI